MIFAALLQQWWEIWSLRATPEWNFLGLVMMLSGPVGLFLMAHLVFPERMEGVNLREYYYGVMRPVWALAAITVVLATSFRPVVLGQDLFSASNATSFVFTIGFVVLAASMRPLLHAVLMPLFSALLLWDILEWSFTLGER